MFERLSDSFQGLYKRLSGQDKLTESNVREAMADVRTALLEADVSVEAVEAFTASGEGMELRIAVDYSGRDAILAAIAFLPPEATPTREAFRRPSTPS